MKHIINAARVPGHPTHWTVETEYTYVIKFPKYMQLLLKWKLHINTENMKRSLNAIHDHLYTQQQGRLVIKEISFTHGRMILVLTVFNRTYEPEIERRFKQAVDVIYHLNRNVFKEQFIEHITKNNIKYPISRKL